LGVGSDWTLVMRLLKGQDYAVHCTVFSLRNFWDFQQLSRLLSSIEAVAAPEYFGEADIVHSDYDRSEIQRWFRQSQDPVEGRPSLELRRGTTPRYSISVNVGNGVHPHSVHLTSNLRHEVGELAKLFELADAIADDAEVDFGSVNLYREGAAKAARLVEGGTFENLGPYIHNGPSDVWARTYFGLRLVALAGNESAFMGSPGKWRRLKSGVLVLDLDPAPWDRTPDELKAAQLAVAPTLKVRTGIFAVPDGNEFGDDVPGPRWQPPAGWLWPA
jgi:hypothetical protein